jgi:hypothetical protein
MGGAERRNSLASDLAAERILSGEISAIRAV